MTNTVVPDQPNGEDKISGLVSGLTIIEATVVDEILATARPTKADRLAALANYAGHMRPGSVLRIRAVLLDS